MNPRANEQSPQEPVEIVQPCSEACACFQRLRDGGWSDYGVCTNPRSPHRGFPVLIGRDCRRYVPTDPPRSSP